MKLFYLKIAKHRLAVLTIAIELALVGGALSAHLDCQKTTISAERGICSSEKLLYLYEYLAETYETALSVVDKGVTCLRSDQQRWEIDDLFVCKRVNCLEESLLERISTLSIFRSQSLVVENFKLPDSPQLLLVIPPQAGDPPNPLSISKESRGKLARRKTNPSMIGIMPTDQIIFDLSHKSDEQHILFENLLDSDPNAKYLVTGRHGSSDYFSKGACRFVYRLRD